MMAQNTFRPLIKLCGRNLAWVETVSHLGYDINCHDRDAEELKRHRRELYARANLLKSRFGSCSVEVKVYLFRMYFSSIYCSSLWVPVKRWFLEQVKVAYNDAFRTLFGYCRRQSASKMFCEHGVNNFSALRRVAAYSLLNRLSNSNNSILKAIVQSNMSMQSSISKERKAYYSKSDS